MNSVLLLGMPSGPEWIVVLFFSLLPVLCIADIIRSEFSHSVTKVAWCAMIVFVPFFGCLLYYWVGTEQKVTSKSNH
jgi:hypothetical protein